MQLRTLFFKTLYILGVGHLMLWYNRGRRRAPVLLFHRITPLNDVVWPGIHPGLFEEIVIMLSKNYSVLPLSVLSDPEKIPPRACFLTFDDGYLDFEEFALPVLLRHKTHTTVFVLPGCIERGFVWTSVVAELVRRTPNDRIGDWLRNAGHHVTLDTENKFRVNHKVTSYMRKLTHQVRFELVEKMTDYLRETGFPMERELMTFEQLSGLSRELVELGSHSLTHPDFESESDEVFLEKELSVSRELLREKMGVGVNLFAFPFARLGKTTLKLVARYYSLAFGGPDKSTSPARLNKENGRYRIGRYHIHHRSAAEVFFLINGFHGLFRS